MHLNMPKSGASQFCTLFDPFQTNLFFLRGDSIFHQECEFEHEFEQELEFEHEFEQEFEREFEREFFTLNRKK